MRVLTGLEELEAIKDSQVGHITLRGDFITRQLDEAPPLRTSQASKMESMTERLEALVAENEDLRRGQIDRLEASLRDGPGVPNTAYAHAERVGSPTGVGLCSP
jgi:hypothetical protein